MKTVQSDDKNTLERIYAAVLGPLSKLLIKSDISLANVVELQKRTLVSAALDQDGISDSLVSLRTGVHRKDVKRIRAEQDGRSAEKSSVQGIAMVLSTWCNDARFTDSTGAPRVLPKKGTADHTGFDDLIKASKVDIGPSTVLQELKENDLVRLHSDGGIELLSETFVPQSGDAALRALEATITDHIRIAADNVLAEPGAPRQFDQVLRYSHLSAQSVETLNAEARKLAREYLETLNAMAHRLQSEDTLSGHQANGRFVTGAFVAPVFPDDQPPNADDTPRTKKDAT